MKDYYKILEVEENASEDEIKKSFRSLSKKYHPDLNPDGGEKFKEINEAYETLGDSNKRAIYNQQKNNPYRNSEFEQFFNSMFGGSQPNFSNQRRRQAPDKIIKIQVTPIESYLGQQKNITYFRDIHCNYCSGTGGDRVICNICEGTGVEIRTYGTGFLIQQVRIACNSCGGRGYKLTNTCFKCGGKGSNSQANELKVSLPRGVDDGQFLKLQAQGDFRSTDYGDLILQVEMISSDNFEKINNDLVYNLYLSYDDLKKERFNVPHPDGELVIPSPKFFDTSKPLRLRGKGYGSGDMIVKLHVRFDRTT
jgi:molecular chaperone DnaJ